MSDTASFIPTVGVSGVFTLAPPFDQMLIPNIIYKCIGVRLLSDLVASGETPYETHYEPKGLSQAIYNADASNGVCIVSISSHAGIVRYVPSSYISGYPDSGGVPYYRVLLGVDLGAIPNSLNLDAIISQIAQLVSTNLGIDTEIQQAVISNQQMINATDHAALESARQQKITNNTSDYANYLAEKTRADNLQIKVTQLEQHILTNVA